VLDLGRSHRLVTPRQYQALVMRDGDTCAYPGCTRTHGLEAHHVRHWPYGGTTDLDNLVLLCEGDHLAHHDGEYLIVRLGGGRFRFLRDGKELPLAVDPSTLTGDRGPSRTSTPTSHRPPQPRRGTDRSCNAATRSTPSANTSRCSRAPELHRSNRGI
jgi:hypothetical protein